MEMQYKYASRMADVPSQLNSVQAALAQPWLRSLLAEALILNGTGAHTGEGIGSHFHRGGGKDGATVIVASSDAERWKSHRGPRACDGGARHTLRTPSGRALAATPLGNATAPTGNAVERGVLALLGMEWCGHAIARHERRHGVAFELVVFVRPDYLFMHPLAPHCEWPSLRHAPITCFRSNGDAMWIAPRSHLAAFTARPLEMHRTCTPPVLRGGSQLHAYHHRFGDCCGPSAEAMLSYAVLTNRTIQAAIDALPTAQQAALERMRCGTRGITAGVILRNVNSAPRVDTPRDCRATCHRSMRHVCDASMQKAYGDSPQLRHSYWAELCVPTHSLIACRMRATAERPLRVRFPLRHSELHERTGLALRRFFGSNVSACREALRYLAEGVDASTGGRQKERCIGGRCSEG